MSDQTATPSAGDQPPSNESDGGGDNVVSFHGTESFPFTARNAQDYCVGQCNRVFVVEKTRMLECRDCSRAIDPFDYLMRWAREGDRRIGGLREMDAALRKKTAELADLRHEITNAKAQLRRAREAHFSSSPPPN